MKSFTLIELVISVLIFSIVLFSIIGVFGGLAKTQFRASSMERLINSTRSLIEIMTKEIRLASNNTDECSLFAIDKNYEVWDGSSWISTINANGTGIRFVDFIGRCVTYKLNGTFIEKTIKKNSSIIGPEAITNNKVKIDYLNFQIIGDIKGNSQPRVVIKIKASVKDDSNNSDLSFEIQNTLSQRIINE